MPSLATLHGVANDDRAAARPRYCAAHEHQVVFEIGTHDLQVERGDLLGTHPPRHAQTTEHTGRRGALADGSGSTVLLVVTVRRVLPAESVALHGAGETLASADRRDIDVFTFFEDLDGQLLADSVAVDVLE